MIIQCTKKLQDTLKVKAEAVPSEAEPLAKWHGNIFTLNRRKCLLLTHDESRYSLYFFGVTQKSLANLPKLFRERLKRELMRDDFTIAQVEKMLATVGEVSFAKSSSRSVLGTMNDMVQMIKHMAVYRETPDENLHTAYINSTPYKIGEYAYPKEVLKTLL